MQSNIYGVFPRLSFIDMSPEQKLAYAADKKAQRMTQEFDKQDATK
jgi:hypothetical protein